MSDIIVVDDLREFPDLRVTYIRTLYGALSWWGGYVSARRQMPVHLWLDHDLGGDDTIRPLVHWMEREGSERRDQRQGLPIVVRVITDNPVGRRWMVQALDPY